RTDVLDPVGLREGRHDMALAIEGHDRDRGAARQPAPAPRDGQEVLGSDLHAATQDRHVQPDHPARRRVRHPFRPQASTLRRDPVARTIARRATASNITGVNRPVKVFCWLGWYEPTSRYGPTVACAPCPNRGLGRTG